MEVGTQLNQIMFLLRELKRLPAASNFQTKQFFSFCPTHTHLVTWIASDHSVVELDEIHGLRHVTHRLRMNLDARPIYVILLWLRVDAPPCAV